MRGSYYVLIINVLSTYFKVLECKLQSSVKINTNKLLLNWCPRFEVFGFLLHLGLSP